MFNILTDKNNSSDSFPVQTTKEFSATVTIDGIAQPRSNGGLISRCCDCSEAQKRADCIHQNKRFLAGRHQPGEGTVSGLIRDFR
jgi:hypothetical protein